MLLKKIQKFYSYLLIMRLPKQNALLYENIAMHSFFDIVLLADDGGGSEEITTGWLRGFP